MDYLWRYIFVGILVDIFAWGLTQTNTIVQVFITYLFYYSFHRFVLHVLDINPHVYVHHFKYFQIPRSVELCIDFVFEVISFGGIPLAIQNLTGLWLVSPSVIILVVLTLSLSHLFNYSILGSEIHKAHHLDMTKNFGPDFLDQLFGTNAAEYEDSFQHIPYLVQACIITHFAKAYFQWKD